VKFENQAARVNDLVNERPKMLGAVHIYV